MWRMLTVQRCEVEYEADSQASSLLDALVR